VASPIKLATVTGASFSNSLHVSLPIVVSMTAVGPVGTGGGASCATAEGASGSASAAAGAVVAGAVVAGCVVVVCAIAAVEKSANEQSRVLRAKFDIFIPD